MLDGLIVTARQTLVLFFLMGFGAFARKCRILDEPSVRRLTDFVLAVVTPALIVNSFQRPFDAAVLRGIFWSFAAAVFAHATAMALGRLAIREREETRRRALRFATVFSNAGFMGLPLEYALLGAEGVFYGSVYIVVFHLLCWTWGVWLVNGGFGEGGIRKAVVNPGIIGVAAGLPLFLFSLRLPGVVAEPVRLIGELNTPLSMVVLGFHLAGARFSAAFKCPAAYTAIVLRHLAVPALLVAALSPLAFIDPVVRLAAVIPAAAPFGAMVTMFAVRYGGDGRFTAALVAVSTLLSIVTLPVVVGAAFALLGAPR